MSIERHIDYIQFTANIQEASFAGEDYEAVSGIPYYPRGYRDRSGIRFYCGANKGANCFVVLSGDCLERHRVSGITDEQVLEWAMMHDAKISRIDLAVTQWNVFTGLVLPENVAIWHEKGEIDSALSSGGCRAIVEVSQSGRSFQTVYVGDTKKRGKRGIFRAYDKGIELDLGEYMATRFELEIKRDKAELTAKRLLEGAGIAPCFRGYFDVRNKDFEMLMDSPSVDMSRGAAKKKSEREIEMEKRWAWLLDQVAPALKEAFEYDKQEKGHSANLEKFMALAGISSDIQEWARSYAEFALRDKIVSIDLLDGKD